MEEVGAGWGDPGAGRGASGARDAADQATRALREAARLRSCCEARDAAGARAWRGRARALLAGRHAWALSGPERPAGLFVVEELLPEEIPSWRASLAPRAAPAIAPLLPGAALDFLLWAARLDHVVACEEARALGLSGADPGELARLRARALSAAGSALGRAARDPACRAALAAMALPARLAGLSELQGFLERGMRAFRALPDPDGFLAELDRVESASLAPGGPSQASGAQV